MELPPVELPMASAEYRVLLKHKKTIVDGIQSSLKLIGRVLLNFELITDKQFTDVVSNPEGPAAKGALIISNIILAIVEFDEVHFYTFVKVLKKCNLGSMASILESDVEQEKHKECGEYYYPARSASGF